MSLTFTVHCQITIEIFDTKSGKLCVKEVLIEGWRTTANGLSICCCWQSQSNYPTCSPWCHWCGGSNKMHFQHQSGSL